MPLDGVIVPGGGNPHARWAVVGERPGEEEAVRRRAFVGRSGRAQDRHLERGGLYREDGWFTNVCKSYASGNPAPTPEEVKQWSPDLLKEIARVNPRYIIAAGRYAARFFLGESTFEQAVHGIPHYWTQDGVERVIIPVYHPAAPFHQPDLLPHVVWDYKRAADTIRGRIPVDPPVDEFPEPEYILARTTSSRWQSSEFAIDSEGVPGDVFSFQFCSDPGEAYVFRGGLPKIRKGSTVIFHNGMYEIGMAASLGVDLLDPDLDLKFFDTMMAAYLLRLEPQSLRMLARRWCGMEMQEYLEVVGQAGLDKQLEYLMKVADGDWPKPEAREKWSNDGTARLYTPQPINRRAEAILIDYYSEKVDKEGERCDPLHRWRKCNRDLRLMVERRFGKMPIGTLADIPIDEAVYYAGRDPDATLRLYPKLKIALEDAGLTDLMDIKMRMLPVAAKISMNGMLGRKSAFEALSSDMFDQMLTLSGKISRKFFGGVPFNPASSPQTATLLRKRGLKGEKRTKLGKMSTSKKSIEHLRYEDEAVELLEQWRERQKIKDSFADSVLENWPDDRDTYRIRGDLKITRVETGRFSMAMLNDVPTAPLMAIPVRNDLSNKVRNCYEAEEGYELFEADLDQAEMRIMADESGDERLVKLFRDGVLDVHTDTAAKMFGIPYDRVDKKRHRYPAKRVGFGVITGIQGPGLLDQLRMAGVLDYDVDDCDRFISEWLKIYPGVKAYMDWCGKECRRGGGIIKDRWGMPRHLPAIFSDETREHVEARRQAHSHRIQAGAQGWIQIAMGEQWRRFKDYGDAVRPVLQIHDSVIYEVISTDWLKDEVSNVVADTMCNVVKLKVPMRSSCSWGKTWGGMKD